ncbi:MULTISPECIES: class I SAM-dependent methyltransferase [unclassified Nostoc]|uniref:class I SAM-dependent methyltransferase n=1 Tax=unclassified Nostoc TaxID=2593658 RepID=UPI00262023D3|nr:class I SAM-dependent methyltransferase [Nostoc sp. S13]MDF5737195.1 class I SAM-dependent methyltransferase [Nostoc sp. S13]
MNNNKWASLLTLRDEIGYIYGSEDLAVLFYSLARRERPNRIVELGTGLGVCSFWIAHALQENGSGHLWTFDNGLNFERKFTDYFHERLKTLGKLLGLQALSSELLSYSDYFTEMTNFLEIKNHVTLLQESIDFQDEIIKAHWPFLDEPIDWLFSDIMHGPEAILFLLAEFLPFLSSCSSIFIDSASTLLTSYLTLERTVEQLNRGCIPRQFLTVGCEKRRARLLELVHQRKFTLIHLTECKDRA